MNVNNVVTTLNDLIDHIEELDDELTLYAVGGVDAAPSSKAVADYEPDDGEVPRAAEGMDYVLEVSEALEVLEVWSQWRDGREPSRDERVSAILHYARHDAYLPV